MSVIRLSDYRKNEFLDSGLTLLHPQPDSTDSELSGDWSPRKRLLFLVFASLACWLVVLAPIYALTQIP